MLKTNKRNEIKLVVERWTTERQAQCQCLELCSLLHVVYTMNAATEVTNKAQNSIWTIVEQNLRSTKPIY